MASSVNALQEQVSQCINSSSFFDSWKEKASLSLEECISRGVNKLETKALLLI